MSFYYLAVGLTAMTAAIAFTSTALIFDERYLAAFLVAGVNVIIAVIFLIGENAATPYLLFFVGYPILAALFAAFCLWVFLVNTEPLRAIVLADSTEETPREEVTPMIGRRPFYAGAHAKRPCVDVAV